MIYQVEMVMLKILLCQGYIGQLHHIHGFKVNYVIQTKNCLRQAPLNSIWEGSGNVICLDVLRTLNKEPSVFDELLKEIEAAKGMDSVFDLFVTKMKNDINYSIKNGSMEFNLRQIVDCLAVSLQGSLLLRYGNKVIAESFIRSRMSEKNNFTYGTLTNDVNISKILERISYKN